MLAFDMHHVTDLAGADSFHHLDERRRIPAVEAQTERSFRRAARVDRALRRRARQRDRLFDVHGFSGFGRLNDLRLVLRMRRRKHNGVDLGVAQHFLVRRNQDQVVLGGEFAVAIRTAGDPLHELDLRATSHRVDQFGPPIAESVYRGI